MADDFDVEQQLSNMSTAAGHVVFPNVQPCMLSESSGRASASAQAPAYA
jgi:hypothetical protein